MLQARDGLPCTLLSINMLNFKIYNDVMGYSEGDALLKAFARILAQAPARCLSRMLADAFLAVPLQGGKRLVTYCEAYSRALNGFIVSGAKLPVGVAFRHLLRGRQRRLGHQFAVGSRQHGLEDDQDEGRGPVEIYDHTMRDKLLRERIWKYAWKRLLPMGNSSSTSSRNIGSGPGPRGREALVRWKSPDQGFLSPGEFIPLLKRTALSSSSISSCSHLYAVCCANGSTPGSSPAPCRSTCRRCSSTRPISLNGTSG